jgi:hypothetical protein
MTDTDPGTFDPQGEVTFDLPFGQVHLDGAPTRVMVPADSLVALCHAAGAEHTAALGRAMGEAIGRRIRVRLGGAVRSSLLPEPTARDAVVPTMRGGTELDARQRAVRSLPFERVVEHLAGELALVGLGSLSAERWGRALVLVVERSPVAVDEHAKVGDELLEAVLAAGVHTATGMPARALCLERQDDRARFAVLNESTAETMRAGLTEGKGWGDLLTAAQRRAKTAGNES